MDTQQLLQESERSRNALLSIIEDQKRISEELRESEAYNRMLFNQSVIGLALARIDGQLVDVNPAYANIIGRTIDETLKLTYWDITPDKYSEQEQKQLESLNTTGSYGPYEKEYIHKDGHLVPVRLQGQIIERKSEKFVWSSVENITERKLAELASKRAEEELKHKEEWERLLSAISNRFVNIHIEHIPSEINKALAEIGTFTDVDRSYIFQFYDDGKKMNNTFEWCNEGIEPQIDNLQGLPSNVFPWWMEILNKHESIIIPKVVDLPSEAKAEKEILESQGIKSLIVLPMVLANSLIGFLGFDYTRKERTWSEDIVNLLRIMGDTFAGIIERKRTEEALRKSEEKFSVIFKKAPFAAALSSITDWRLLEVNEAYENLWGYSSEEVIGKTSEELDMYPDLNERARLGAIFRKQGFLHNAETKLRTKSGSLRDILINSDVVNIGNERYVLTTAQNITERKLAELASKRAEEMLRESEERYRTLFDDVPVGLFRSTPSGKILELNLTASKMLGFDDRKEAMTHNISDFWLNPEERKHKMPSVDQEGMIDIEIQLRRHDKQIIWVHNRGRSVRDHQGKILYFDGSMEDITERKRAEEELRENEARLKLALEASRAGVWEWNLQTNEILWSDENYRLLGYKPGIVKPSYDNWLTRVHPEDRDKADAGVAIAVENKSGLDIEFRLLLPDGSVCWINDRGKFMFDENGKTIKMHGIQIDITERKRTEEMLRKSEARYRKLIETEPECVKVLTEDNILRDMNPAGLAMIEADSPNQVVDKSILGVINPEDRPAFTDLVKEVFRGGSGTLEFRITGLKGTNRWLETHAVPMSDENGKIHSLLSVTRDITERKLAELASKQAEEKITEQLNELKRWQVVMIGREKRNIELKHEVNELMEQLGKPEKYKS